MNGQISQMISLVTYANAFLQGQKVSYDLDNSSAHGILSIEFIEITSYGTHEKRVLISESPNDWFELLQAQGVERVRIHYLPPVSQESPDRTYTAFCGGTGRWTIETIQGESNILWESEWIWEPARNVTDVGYGRRWKVVYYILAKDCEPPATEHITLENAHEKLTSALLAIESFANNIDMQFWANKFRKGLNALVNDNLCVEYYGLPVGCLPNEAEQLIAAGYASMVFGGMGSWNDIWFEEDKQDEYNIVSDNLYEALCASIVAGVNSYPTRV